MQEEAGTLCDSCSGRNARGAWGSAGPEAALILRRTLADRQLIRGTPQKPKENACFADLAGAAIPRLVTEHAAMRFTYVFALVRIIR